MSIRSRLKERNVNIAEHHIKKNSPTDWLFLFTSELYLRGVITLRDHHTYWGRYYKYPECCIDFYITLLENGIKNPAKFMWDRYPIYLQRGKYYVECLDCVNKAYNLYE